MFVVLCGACQIRSPTTYCNRKAVVGAGVTWRLNYNVQDPDSVECEPVVPYNVCAKSTASVIILDLNHIRVRVVARMRATDRV